MGLLDIYENTITNPKPLTEDYFKDLIVISYNEVESNVELQSVGMVTV